MKDVLPRAIASREAFDNAMALDLALGGSTNTVLHLLAAAHEAELDYSLKDIEARSAQVPCLTKVAPNGHHLQDWLAAWDIRSGTACPEAVELFHAAPGCKRSSSAFSQSEQWDSLDLDADEGCIRDVEHAHSADGGLAVLRGNLAIDGSVVKTAGVDPSMLSFTGSAIVVESQEDAVDAILTGRVVAGSVLVVRYEGPRAVRGCRRCSTQRPSWRDEVSAVRVLLSPTAASPAEVRGCLSAMSPRGASADKGAVRNVARLEALP